MTDLIETIVKSVVRDCGLIHIVHYNDSKAKLHTHWSPPTLCWLCVTFGHECEQTGPKCSTRQTSSSGGVNSLTKCKNPKGTRNAGTKSATGKNEHQHTMSPWRPSEGEQCTHPGHQVRRVRLMTETQVSLITLINSTHRDRRREGGETSHYQAKLKSKNKEI